MTTQEWHQCLKNEGVKQLLDELCVPEAVRKDVVDILDADGSGTVTTAELREALLRCRGQPHAADLVDCKLKLQHLQHYLQRHLESQMHLIHDMLVGDGKDKMDIMQDMLQQILDRSHQAEPMNPQQSTSQSSTEPVKPQHINKS